LPKILTIIKSIVLWRSTIHTKWLHASAADTIGVRVKTDKADCWQEEKIVNRIEEQT
jgi:hypothetical protein